MTVPRELLEAARRAGVNLSATLERALEQELAAMKRRQWLADHVEAIQAYNEHVSRHAPALADVRTF